MKRVGALVIGICAALYGGQVAAQEVVTAEQVAAADLKKGQRVFLRCRACHTLAEGDRNKVGPNLWMIFDSEIGVREDFTYSPALQEADFVWTADKLNEWLIKPKDFLPGNKMAFVGLNREADRVNLIGYLMNETGYVMGGTAEEGEDAGEAVDDGASDDTAGEAPTDSDATEEPTATGE